MMVGINAICYEGIARVYRNAVVCHIRVILSAMYPETWEEKIAIPFTAEEWSKAKEEAERSFKTGALEIHPKDAADLLGVNHFYNVFDRHFDLLFPKERDSSLSDQKRKKQDILTWTKMIKNYRDPVIGHPVDDEVTKEDAGVILDFARRILLHFNTEAAQKIRELIYSLNPDIEISRVLEDSLLPPRETIAPYFIGRQIELSQLRVWIDDPNSRVSLLAGDGGKGKTAIAYEFAVEVKQNPPTGLETVIWLSAKPLRFASGVSVRINNPDFTDLNSALDHILSAYGTPDIADMDIQRKQTQCLEYMATLPALIVLDDVDSLEGQDIDAMNFFMHRTQATPSKVLLTSRRIPFGMEPEAIQITGFLPRSEDGRKFIHSRLKMHHIDDKLFTRADIDKIIEICDGSPLFIQDLLRLCKVGEPPRSAIKIWQRRAGNDAREYAFRREFEMLTDPAKAVLLTCALFSDPISLTEIQVYADLHEERSRTAITELHRVFLVPAASLIEGVPRFQLETNTRQLGLKSKVTPI